MSTTTTTTDRDLIRWRRAAEALEAVGHLTDIIHAVRQQSRQHAEHARTLRAATVAGALPGFMTAEAADAVAEHHEREADGLEAVAHLLYWPED